MLSGRAGSGGKCWNQWVLGFNVINLFDSDWGRWHGVNYSANGHMVFVTGLYREGGVGRMLQFSLADKYYVGLHRPIAMEDPLWTNLATLGWLGQETQVGELYFTHCFPAQVRTGKQCRLRENKVKGDCCLMSNSATQGWVGAQARAWRRLPEALRKSLPFFLFPGSWNLKHGADHTLAESSGKATHGKMMGWGSESQRLKPVCSGQSHDLKCGRSGRMV